MSNRGRDDRRGRNLGAWLYVAGPPDGSEMFCRLYGWSTGAEEIGPRQGDGQSFATNTWVYLTQPLGDDNAAATLSRILLHCFLPRASWRGAAYLDDVTIE